MLCICVFVFMRSQGRTHKGLDILCSDGSNVLAPFDVQLNGKLTVYADPTNAQTAINKGINLRGEGPLSLQHVLMWFLLVYRFLNYQ